MEVKEKQETSQEPQVTQITADEQEGYTLDEVVQRSARRGGKRASRAAVVPLLLAIMALGAATAFAVWYFTSNPVDLSGYNSASSEYNYAQKQQNGGVEYPSFTHATTDIGPQQAKGMSVQELAAYEDTVISTCLLAHDATPTSETAAGPSKDQNILTFWGDGQQRVSKIIYYLGTSAEDSAAIPGYTYPVSANVYLDGEFYGVMELKESKDGNSFYACQLDEPKTVTTVTLELTKWAKDKGTNNYELGQVAFE